MNFFGGFVLTGFLILCPLSTNGLYFNMRHSSGERCFLEELAYDTLVLAKFKVEPWNPMPTPSRLQTARSANSSVPQEPIGLNVVVRDPNENDIVSKNFGATGRLAFTSNKDGEHKICLSSNDTYLPGFLRVHLDVRQGGAAVDYDQVQKREKLTNLQLKLRKLQDKTTQIIKEQNFQRAREARFRYTSESTNSRVFWFATLQTVLLLVIAFFQLRHLKFFFIQKKLV